MKDSSLIARSWRRFGTPSAVAPTSSEDGTPKVPCSDLEAVTKRYRTPTSNPRQACGPAAIPFWFPLGFSLQHNGDV